MTFHIVTSGQCFFNFKDEIIELNEGDAVFMPSDSRHCLINSRHNEVPENTVESLPMTEILSETSTGLVCGDFTHRHAIFDKLLKQLPELIVVRREDSASSQIIELMLAESRNSNQHSNVLLNRLSDCLFYLLVRGNVDIESGVFAAFAHPQLSQAMELIHQSLDKEIGRAHV